MAIRGHHDHHFSSSYDARHLPAKPAAHAALNHSLPDAILNSSNHHLHNSNEINNENID
jgi:hypothetical protein